MLLLRLFNCAIVQLWSATVIFSYFELEVDASLMDNDKFFILLKNSNFKHK